MPSDTFLTGFPHATITDDVYEGFRIPKGIIIIFNEW
ncbi:hypothetical protein AZE42_11861 [Rhizopogon vesiculosus]|uniref:Uncharacterized protein n=1 Tax=Rhizopogon vesiculosus TaxID=180088 RepID=A0A1J8PM57_9AGAM|nr:hypothetical protein AZE42_11861 [Rhizopogon vesiculosus]